MKICMVSDYYYPHVGGVAEHIWHLAAELRRRGHCVRVLTASYPRGVGRGGSRIPDGGEVFRIGRGVLVPTNRSFARVVVAWRPEHQVRRFFRREGFDIVHIHGSLAPTLPLVALGVSEAVNFFTFHAGHNSNLGYELFKPLLTRYFHKVHGPIAVSEAALWSTSLYFPGRYRVIPNGVDGSVFKPDAPHVPELENGRPKILFMGRFDPRKGLVHLLRALPQVKREVPGVQCVVAGSGPLSMAHYRRWVPPEVSDDVVFTGTIYGEDRARYYASCDVLCAPSTGNESFGIILLEAMASGRPVVASDIHGYREVLSDGVEGLTAPPGDEQAIADRLMRILRDPSIARRMGAVGREKSERYSWKRVADQVESYYREVTAHSRR